ncbi:MAG: cell wall-binding repeat-containing protein [Tissierella sp.]|uniref:cell wall-binding repeat-containing protein n=1 Tax=Tissierella sp. TaxID=41274 RepID=UPI003F9E5577
MRKYSKLMAVLLVFAMILPGIAQAAPVAGEYEVSRLAGSDRVKTAIAVSEEAYDKADTVVLAGFSGEPDALTGTLLADEKNAPLLLTYKNKLDADLMTEIERLGAKNVYILGGEAAVQEKVADALKAEDLNVKRIKGSDRTETAIKIAEEVFGSETAEKAFVVEFNSLADALAIGPVSAQENAPILITYENTVPQATIDAAGTMGVKDATIVGGTAAVSAQGKEALEDVITEVDRVSGKDREATALAIAARYFNNPQATVVANGYKYADALVGGYFAAMHNAPILLSQGTKINNDLVDYVHNAGVNTYVLGGTGAIDTNVFEALASEVQEPEEPVEAKVESASAINASELEVKFNVAVDEDTAKTQSNYQLKVNNDDMTNNITDIQISEDGKTATLLLAEGEEFQNGDKYVLQTKDAIKSAEGKNLEKFVSEEMTFNESKAPSLKKVDYKNGKLEFTFDRPVAKDVTLIKVDGVEITEENANTELSGRNTEAGDYKYTATITVDTAKDVAKKKGIHEVVLFDVEDTASAYPSVASVLTGKYTITDAVTTPEVLGVEEVNANRFFVETNTEVELSEDSVIVNKGTHEFPSNNNEIVNGNGSESFATPGTKDGNTGIWVVVSDKEEGNENPLYRKGETSVDLTVTIEKYKANGLFGKKATREVTLHKNNTKPVVDSTVLRDKKDLVVTFENDIKIEGALSEGTDFVVRDKDDIIIEGFGETLFSGKEIVFNNNEELKDAPYTIEFKADKFQNAEDETNVATYLVNTLKNDKMFVTVGEEVETNFKYKEFDLAENLEIGENILEINYRTEMGDSAREVKNYRLDGKGLPNGTTADFVGGREKVRIVFPEETFEIGTKYKLGITTDVKTQAGSIIVGSLQTKAPAEAIFTSKDNVKPELESALYYVGTEDVDNKTMTNKIEVTFDEDIDINIDSNAADNFKVEIAGSEFEVESVEKVTGKDNKLELTLENHVNVSQSATITIVLADENDEDSVYVKDLAVNKAKVGSSVKASKTKFNEGVKEDIDSAVEDLEKLAVTYEKDLKASNNDEYTKVALNWSQVSIKDELAKDELNSLDVILYDAQDNLLATNSLSVGQNGRYEDTLAKADMTTFFYHRAEVSSDYSWTKGIYEDGQYPDAEDAAEKATRPSKVVVKIETVEGYEAEVTANE